MKKGINKEVKIGFAFIVSLFLLYFGISFLKGINIFKPSNSYTVVFHDVTDLTLSSPVYLNGFQVGLVYSMELDKNDPNKIYTVLNLDKGIKIPRGSKIKLEASLLGSASVILEQNPYTTEYYSEKDIIEGERNNGLLESLSADVLPQVAVLFPKLDTIISGIQVLVTNEALSRSLDNVEDITRELANSSRQLNRLLGSLQKDLPEITSNFNAVSNDMAEITNQFKSIDLASSYNSLDSTLRNIQYLSEKINSSDNSVGLLLNDRQLYDSIATSIGNASELLRDVRENPSRYINVKVF